MIHFGTRWLKSDSDENLMHLFQQGHTAAFEILYKRYSGPILHYFYRMLNGNTDHAQDFLQELFYKIIDKKESYDANQKFASWIYSIAANMCKNEYRRINNKNTAYNNLQQKVSSEESSGGENMMHDKIMADKIWNELAGVNDLHKSVFILRFQKGYSLKEISEIMQCSEGTVKSRLFYAIKKISKKLGEIDHTV